MAKCKGMLSTLAFATKGIADSSHYIKARIFTASAAQQSLSSYCIWPYHSSSAKQNNTPFLFCNQKWYPIISERCFLYASALINAAIIISGTEIKLEIISADFCVLGLQFKSSLILGGLGRGRSWCTDIWNTLDEELERKILFLNANGRKNSERVGKTVQMLHYVHNDM